MKICRCDIVRISFGLLFFLLLLGWGTGGRLWAPISLYFPTFHLTFAATLALALVPAVRRAAAAIWERIVPRRYGIFPLLAFAATLIIHLLVFQGIPHIQDSIHYRMMADQFAHGKLDLPMHPYYEFFRYLYLIPDGEKIYSLFLPGYSFFLVPFVRAGLLFLANPLLTAASVALTGRIAEEFFGPRTAAATMALVASSAFLMVMGGTAMAHPFCAFLTLLIVHFFLRARAADERRRAIILSAAAGALLGWLLFTRPQNALFLVLPLALAALSEIRRKGTFLRGVALAVAFLPWLIALLAYNAHYTGDPLLFKQDPYFNYSEPNDLCHRFGIGRGCPNSNWTELPAEGLTWTHAAYVTYRRLSPLLVNTFGHPLLFLLVPLAFLLQRGLRPRREIFLGSLFLATVGGYYFFYFDGNVFGPRYYYETTFLLAVLAAQGIRNLNERIAAARRPALFSVPLGAFVAAAYIFTALFVLPPLLTTYAKGFWTVEKSLSDTVEKMGVHHAVVFVSDEGLIGSGFAVMRHDDWELNDVIYARDLGDRPNSALMHHYTGRGFYRARYAKPQGNDDPPVITPLGAPELPPHYIVAEMEDKHYPLKGEPDYCNEYPNRADLDKYAPFPPDGKLGIDLSKKALFCRFHDPDEYYTFGQNILVPGRYTIEFVGLTGPEMDRFRLYIDDRPAGTLDFTGERYEKVSRTVEADLAAGLRFFRLEPEDRSRDTYFFLDLVELFIRGL